TIARHEKSKRSGGIAGALSRLRRREEGKSQEEKEGIVQKSRRGACPSPTGYSDQKKRLPSHPLPLPTTPLAASFRLRRTGKRGENSPLQPFLIISKAGLGAPLLRGRG